MSVTIKADHLDPASASEARRDCQGQTGSFSGITWNPPTPDMCDVGWQARRGAQLLEGIIPGGSIAADISVRPSSSRRFYGRHLIQATITVYPLNRRPLSACASILVRRRWRGWHCGFLNHPAASIASRRWQIVGRDAEVLPFLNYNLNPSSTCVDSMDSGIRLGHPFSPNILVPQCRNLKKMADYLFAYGWRP